MSNRILITSGCSFTDPNFKSVLEPEIDCGFKKWPEVFNNLCNDEFDLVNLGVCGLGNDYIFKSAIDSILKNINNVGLVIIGMSEMSRFSFGQINSIYSTRFYEIIKDVKSFKEYEFVKNESKWNQHVCNLFELTNTPSDLMTCVNSMLIQIYLFQVFCKEHKIEYIISPMLPQYDIGLRNYFCNIIGTDNYWTETNIARCIFKSKIYNLIDESKILLWPFLPSLGGGDFHSLLTTKERLGKIDMHPNEIGHKKIAKNIYDFYINL